MLTKQHKTSVYNKPLTLQKLIWWQSGQILKFPKQIDSNWSNKASPSILEEQKIKVILFSKTILKIQLITVSN